MPEPARLAGRVAIVTGGLSGIGAAIARRLHEAGAQVTAADIAGHEAPPGVVAHKVDVTDAGSVQAMVDAVLARHGRIDCVVTSAGIGADMPFLDTNLATFDRIIAVNLRGTFLVCQACARVMQPGASIVTIASISGLRGNIGRAAYGASKGGVVTLTQVMATELAPQGIRANAIAPGPVDTPLVARMHDPAIRAAWMRATPMGRYAVPDEIAGAAAFLCSDEASFVTGHVLAVDGGFLGAGLSSR